MIINNLRQNAKISRVKNRRSGVNLLLITKGTHSKFTEKVAPSAWSSDYTEHELFLLLHRVWGIVEACRVLTEARLYSVQITLVIDRNYTKSIKRSLGFLSFTVTDFLDASEDSHELRKIHISESTGDCFTKKGESATARASGLGHGPSAEVSPFALKRSKPEPLLL